MNPFTINKGICTALTIYELIDTDTLITADIIFTVSSSGDLSVYTQDPAYVRLYNLRLIASLNGYEYIPI